MDFLSHEAMLVVEVDGGQHAEAREYDNKRTDFIKEKGFQVLQFWSNEVLENMRDVLTVIREAMDAPHSGQHPHPAFPRKRGKGR